MGAVPDFHSFTRTYSETQTTSQALRRADCQNCLVCTSERLQREAPKKITTCYVSRIARWIRPVLHQRLRQRFDLFSVCGSLSFGDHLCLCLRTGNQRHDARRPGKNAAGQEKAAGIKSV